MSVDLAELENVEYAPLEALQGFDPASIARTDALGRSLDFTPAVPVVGQVVQYFRLFPRDLLHNLPETQRTQVTTHASTCWTTVQQMLQFDPNTSNPANERQGLINQLKAQYSDALTSTGGSLAVISALQRSGSGVDMEARAALEAAKERSEDIKRLQKETAETSARILEGVRSVAAQAGVSHEAKHFGQQADTHAEAAKTWQKYTNRTAAALIAFALLTWIIGYNFSPTDAYQAAQLGLSKLLIFSTIAYLLFQCARTMMAHRHNEVVNRHRQNALLTFETLAEASSTPETKDVVLTQASGCIYAPQESGFSKPGSNSSPSLIEVLPRVLPGSQ